MPPSDAWPDDPDVLRLYRRSDRCTVLGPGVRAVLWVQGCPLRCPGCVAAETLPFAGGTEIRIETLADELLALPADVQGVTFSGGEPTSQPAALCNLIDRIRARRDFSFFCYSGFTLEHLQSHGSDAQRALLSRLDVLVDGPYVQSRHTDLRWRGSDNQRVHFLSDRYRHLAEFAQQRGSWMEVELEPDGSVQWMGIPPAGFRDAFQQRLEAAGILLEVRSRP